MTQLQTVCGQLHRLLVEERAARYELSRSGYYLSQLAELGTDTKLEGVIAQISTDMELIVSGAQTTGEQQQTDVLLHLEALTGYHTAMHRAHSQRAFVYGQVLAAQTRVHTHRKTLDTARSSASPSLSLSLSKASQSLAEAELALTTAKLEFKRIGENLVRDLRWLDDLQSFEIQNRMMALTQMRAAEALRERERW
eukprot:CAMPEP_0182424588 /NCGR_PEP_ID=MMETSP1167-20130531/10794_1 /TAXON_ID=2988 /ORGANISM="Mallomonas Sp, Strain CCMP3275" /LENGTH=195 /DNA_ID=CAMNT_0024604491 /DNA_START=275 /DNA_END=859 /DNA_ORIENTATION=+